MQVYALCDVYQAWYWDGSTSCVLPDWLIDKFKRCQVEFKVITKVESDYISSEIILDVGGKKYSPHTWILFQDGFIYDGGNDEDFKKDYQVIEKEVER